MRLDKLGTWREKSCITSKDGKLEKLMSITDDSVEGDDHIANNNNAGISSCK